MEMFYVYYAAMKAMLLYGLVHSMVKFENLQKHWLFLALIYVGGVVVLSWIWFIAPQENPDLRAWQLFCLKTLGLGVLYFRLLSWFDEGFIFWTLLLLGMAVVYY